MVDVAVVGESVKPGDEGSALPPVPAHRLPCLKEYLLGEILRLRMAAGPEIQVPVHALDETVVQLAKRSRVSVDHDAIDERYDPWVVRALGGLGRLGSR